MEEINDNEKMNLIHKILKYEKIWNPKVYKDLYENKEYNAIAQIGTKVDNNVLFLIEDFSQDINDIINNDNYTQFVNQLNDLTEIIKKLAFLYYQSQKK